MSYILVIDRAVRGAGQEPTNQARKPRTGKPATTGLDARAKPPDTEKELIWPMLPADVTRLY